jgi:hypothetical protein
MRTDPGGRTSVLWSQAPGSYRHDTNVVIYIKQPLHGRDLEVIQVTCCPVQFS